MSTQVADPKPNPGSESTPPAAETKPGERQPDVPIGHTKEGVVKAIEGGRWLADRLLKQSEERMKRLSQEAKPTAEEKPAEADGTGKAEGDTPKKPRKKKERDPGDVPLTKEQIAEVAGSAAAAVVREMRSEMPKPPAPEPEPAKVEVPEEYADDKAVILHLASNRPEYKDFVQKLADFSKREESYIGEWKKNNPGQEYDPDAPEHDEFFAERPVIAKKDRDAATVEIIREQVRADLLKEITPKLAELEAQKIEKALQPKVEQIISSVQQAVSEVINSDDPEDVKIRDEVTKNFTPLLSAVAQLYSGVRFNPENQAHVAAETVAAAAEGQIKAMPPEDQVDEHGRKFATIEEYGKMSSAERQRHWYLDEPNLVAIISSHAKRHTRAVKEQREFQQWQASRSNGKPVVSKTGREEHKPLSPSSREVRGPSVGASPAVGTDSGSGGNGNMRGRDVFWQRIGISSP